MSVELIFDNLYPLTIKTPKAMGEPKEGQLASSPMDNLCELAGRVCYDSLGQGRSSAEYHQHIREVVNLSVYRHATFTVIIPESNSQYEVIDFVNRPGLWVDWSQNGWRVTMNLQHVREWTKWGLPFYNKYPNGREHTAKCLASVAKRLAPLACADLEETIPGFGFAQPGPLNDRERWLSFFITDVSRGLSHELVRHTAWTAPSQRSTRYCDESESPWIWHPLIERNASPNLRTQLARSQALARSAYDATVLELMENGASRKEARGAARGVLGNALMTELIYSASVAEWKHLVSLRNHPAADEEIRVMAQQIEAVLKECT